MSICFGSGGLRYLAWVFVVIVVFAVDGFCQDVPELLRAGAFALDITPVNWPVSVNGGMSTITATAAHEKLYARCLVLSNKTTSLAFVVCDSFAIPRDLADQAKVLASTKTGIPASHILISANHCRKCPAVVPFFQCESNSEYSELLVKRIAQAIERANRQLEPAQVGWGAIEQRSLLFNHRWRVKEDEETLKNVVNPFGLKSDRVISNPGFNNTSVTEPLNSVDPELCFLSVQSRKGRPIALLANYSLDFVGGTPQDLVAADYFGEFSRRLAVKLKATDVRPAFVGMMSIGSSADVSGVDYRQKSPAKREEFEQISLIAELLSQEVAKACEGIEYSKVLPLGAQQSEIVVGVRKPIPNELQEAERTLLTNQDGPSKELSAIYARETTLMENYPTSMKIQLQAIKIGSLAIVACPCEMFAETGLSLKKTSPFKKTFVISRANGYNGYLVPPEQFLLGGYETWRSRSSYLTTDVEPKVQLTLKRLLREVNQ